MGPENILFAGASVYFSARKECTGWDSEDEDLRTIGLLHVVYSSHKIKHIKT